VLETLNETLKSDLKNIIELIHEHSGIPNKKSIFVSVFQIETNEQGTINIISTRTISCKSSMDTEAGI
jgi:hypothetical protein